MMFVTKSRNLLLTSAGFTDWSHCRLTVALRSLSKSRRMRNGKMKSSAEAPVQPEKMQATRFVSVDLNDSVDNLKRTDSNDINFEDHKNAFHRKSTWEIARALCVLRMSSINVFVNNSLSIMNWTRRVLGPKGLRTLFKPVLYKQFVGGENEREIQECLRKLSETGVRPMLAAAMEEDVDSDDIGNEAVFDSNCSRILECLEIATTEDTLSPMMQLKMSALLPADLLVTLGNAYCASEEKLKFIHAIAEGLTEKGLTINPLPECLDDKKLSMLRNALFRLKKIGQDAHSRRVKILVDAEYTYFNSGLSLLTNAMVSIYNQEAPQIWNTYQCYLKEAKSKLLEEMQLAQQMSSFFGAKLVRGAYMVQEKERAMELKLPDPVCADYPATNDNYNALLAYLLEQTKTLWPKCSFIAATHNEESIKVAIKKMEDLGIDRQHGNVSFGQLYGMCDQVTYPLVISGYAVYKSIPYGTVDEVLPYLARRAVENKTVLAGTRKEQSLLWKEMKHRLRLKRSRHQRSR